MPERFLKRAAQHAALFVLGAALGPVVALGIRDEAVAKMRADTLSISRASGGETPPLAVEIAESDEERALGLMYRTALADGQGMLFPNSGGGEATMWMRNTYIPLDMVFIKPDGVILRIEAMTEPLSDKMISSGGPVAAVLELAGGAAGRLGIKPGDRVLYRLFQSAATGR